MRRLFVGTGVCLALVLSAGCGANPPPIIHVECVVKLGGAPLPNAKVIFHPQFADSAEFVATGMTDESGRIVPTCKGQFGACAVEHVVAVVEEIPEALTPESKRGELAKFMRSLKNRPIPPVYANVAESPARVTFAAGKKEYEIDLKR